MEMTSDKNFLKVSTSVTANEEHSEVRVKTDLAQIYCDPALRNKKTQRRGNPNAGSSGADFEKTPALYMMSEYMTKNPGNGRAC